MRINKSKKIHSLIKFNYIFRICGLLAGNIILLSVTDYPLRPTVIMIIFIGLLWPHIAFFISTKKLIFDDPIISECLHFCVDSFIYGLVTYITSFNLLVFITMWISNIINTFSTAGIKLFLRSLIAYILGVIILFPFVEFTIKPGSNIITTILCLIFITLYTTITANNLYLSIFSDRKKRKQIQIINKKFESELEFAKSIQINLMPQNNPIQNIACLYNPMRQVGGDFYDFVKFRDPDKIGIFISDVSGHGVPAAFITSMLKSILLQAGDKKDNPSELLLYTNNLLQKQITENFVTAFYGIYNHSERTIFYSNAGHNQPYLIQSEIIQLPPNKSRVLAMFNNIILNKNNNPYKNYKETLPIGSKLLLYTDGLVEARPIDGKDFFEHTKMFDVFLKNKDKASDEFIKNLYKELVAFRKSEIFDDDICLICLDVK